MKKIFIYLFCILGLFSNYLFAIRNDYYFDVSPLIQKEKMFSIGLGGIFEEYNSWYQNGLLNILDPYNANISRRDIYFTIAPFFNIRPIRFIELGFAASFVYRRQDSRNDSTRLTNKTDSFGFKDIDANIKITMLDWYLSLGTKIGASFSFQKDSFLYTQRRIKDNFNFYANIMIAGVPKVIPVNILFCYIFDPQGDFVKLTSVDTDAKTVVISDEELGEIKHTPKQTLKPDIETLEKELNETNYDDDDDFEYDNKEESSKGSRKNRDRERSREREERERRIKKQNLK